MNWLIKQIKRYADWIENMTKKGYSLEEVMYSIANACLPNLFPLPEKRNQRNMVVYWTQVIAVWLAVFSLFYVAHTSPQSHWDDLCRMQQNAMSQAHVSWILANWNGSINFSNHSIYLEFMVANSDMDYSNWNNDSLYKEKSP